MKNKTILMSMVFLSLINTSCNAQCDNKQAVERFKKDIEVLQISMKNSETNLKEIPEIVERIESVTMIESESDGNYFGKLKATESDFSKWNNWLEKNKTKLCWNESKKTYSITK